MVHVSHVSIECADALKYIRRWDSPQTLFYVDPPYPGSENGHYGGYTQQDFEALCDVLDNVHGSFLLSCYDNPAARAGEPEWERFEFSALCWTSMRGKTNLSGKRRSRAATQEELGNRRRTEVVWRRFRRSPVRPEIQKLFDSGAFDCFTGDA